MLTKISVSLSVASLQRW